MTSIAVTASICASVSEVALLVASLMPVFSLNLSATDRGAKHAHNRQNFTRNTPRRVFAYTKVPTQRTSTVPGSNSIAAAIWLARVEARIVFGRNHRQTVKTYQRKHRRNHGPHRL